MAAKPLEGKVAVVTGSAKRLGKAIALSLAANGADVVVHYMKSSEEAMQTEKEIESLGKRCMAFRADLTKPAEAEALFGKAYEEFGRVDILVNNVGEYMSKDISEMEPEEWNHVIGGTLNATFHCCRYCLPYMRKQRYGRIISIGTSSIEKLAPSITETAYRIGKTGILMLTKSIAKKYAADNITANVVWPGVMFNSVVFPKGGEKAVPAGRYTGYEDVTAAILFLLSEQAGHITGNNIAASGGYNI